MYLVKIYAKLLRLLYRRFSDGSKSCRLCANKPIRAASELNRHRTETLLIRLLRGRQLYNRTDRHISIHHTAELHVNSHIHGQTNRIRKRNRSEGGHATDGHANMDLLAQLVHQNNPHVDTLNCIHDF